MKFNDRQLAALKPRSERYEVWEGAGLGIRVSPAGRKTWVLMYRFAGVKKRLCLGVYPKMNLAAAHKAQERALAKVALGVDPQGEKITARKVQREALTLNELVSEYLENHAKPNKRSWADDKRLLEKEITPHFGRLKAKDLTRAEIVSLLDQIVRRAPITANRAFAALRKTYNWGISRSLVEHSPCDHISRPAPENRRDRTLSEAELRLLWIRLTAEPALDPVRLALQMILASAQRSGEVLGATWAEIDLEALWWTIPGERAKNGLPHRVPITPLSKRILLRAKEAAWGSDLVFPSPRVAKPPEGSQERPKPRPLERHALGHWIDRYLEKLEGAERFTTHDLRRSAASQMTSMGIPRLVVSKILNHAEPGVTAVYDRNSYDGEKRAALEKWNAKLRGLAAESRKGVA